MTTAHVFIDYQNVHLSAWECFASYSTPRHESLIHPGKFADAVTAVWNEQNDDDLRAVRVFVYRGLPDPRREGRQNSRVNQQHSHWARDDRVTVNARPLRYPREWPDERAQEKGVDVMLALGVVRCAIDSECDRVIVATRDSDILPAIEMAEVEKPGSVIIATWDGGSVLRAGSSVPIVRLDKRSYNRSRDTNRYN
jgi:uncharacterized LabA/DUF88 family protein